MMNYDEKPFLVIWETTRACDLACVHCRAEAIPTPDQDELSTGEAKKLIDSVAAMGSPVFIFSGGDPMKRADIFQLVLYAKKKRLRVGLIPAITPKFSKEDLLKLKKVEVDQIAFSLDAETAAKHDAFRRVPGVFDRTLEAVSWAHEIGLKVQINSLINLHNFQSVDKLFALIESLPIVFWEVFFLVPMGRGNELSVLNAQQFEEVFEKLYELNHRAKFVLKVTEAPHYRRYFSERECVSQSAPVNGGHGHSYGRIEMPQALRRAEGPGGSIGLAPRGVNSGKGFAFVSRKGEIMPSGFLPIAAGNVRTHDLADVYRNSPLFRELRNPALLKGRCAVCSYIDICGGSRSRAYAMKGDYLEEDPCCAYIPATATALHLSNKS